MFNLQFNCGLRPTHGVRNHIKYTQVESFGDGKECHWQSRQYGTLCMLYVTVQKSKLLSSLSLSPALPYSELRYLVFLWSIWIFRDRPSAWDRVYSNIQCNLFKSRQLNTSLRRGVLYGVKVGKVKCKEWCTLSEYKDVWLLSWRKVWGIIFLAQPFAWWECYANQYVSNTPTWVSVQIKQIFQSILCTGLRPARCN